jgi:hypothetical protein
MSGQWDDNGWIEIHDWEDHNPGHTRSYSWIKVHKRLLHDPKFLDLTMAQRGVAMGLWILTGELGLGNVPARVATLTRLLGCTFAGDTRSLRRHLVSLNHAGWLANIACEVHAERMSRLRERVEEKPLKVSPSTNAGKDRLASPPRRLADPTTMNGANPSPTEPDDDLQPLNTMPAIRVDYETADETTQRIVREQAAARARNYAPKPRRSDQ